MEWLNQFADIIANNWDRVLLIVTTPIISGLSIWQLGKIIIRSIQNFTAKKYTKKVEKYKNEIFSEINSLKDYIKTTIKEEVKLYADTIKNGFNELEERKQAKKQEIYEKTFGIKQDVEEIVQEIKTEIKEEIEQIPDETPKAEEVVKEIEIVEIKPEKKPKKIDLL